MATSKQIVANLKKGEILVGEENYVRSRTCWFQNLMMNYNSCGHEVFSKKQMKPLFEFESLRTLEDWFLMKGESLMVGEFRHSTHIRF